jgi:hypothetical protein
MKTVYLHIGANKAGTTSIQRFLNRNSDWLKEKGVLYPSIGIYNNAHYELSSFFRFGPNLPYPSKFSLKKLKKQIDNSSEDKIILSSEFFMLNSHGDLLGLKDLLSGYAVKVVLYLRRHDLWFESLYNQAVKKTRNPPWKKGTQSYLNFHLNRPNVRFDYLNIIDRWGGVFGKEAIVVRPFEKQQFFQNDLVSDFLNTIGVSFDNRPSSSEDRSNASLSVRILDFVDSLNRVEGIEEHDKAIAIRAVADITKNDKKRFAISPGQRRELIKQFESNYEEIAREYLGRSDERLLYERLPELDEEWREPEKVTLPQALGLFARLARKAPIPK